MKRLFDFSAALLAILVLLPMFLVISVLITLDSRGGIFYKQRKVGADKIELKLYKFRTMHFKAFENRRRNNNAHDHRITRLGYWLRKYKIDELPHLVNILKGELSFYSATRG